MRYLSRFSKIAFCNIICFVINRQTSLTDGLMFESHLECFEECCVEGASNGWVGRPLGLIVTTLSLGILLLCDKQRERVNPAAERAATTK